MPFGDTLGTHLEVMEIDDDKPWLITEEIPETVTERIEEMQKTIDYLTGEVERKKTRNQRYAEKQEKNPCKYTRFYRVKNKELSRTKMLNNTDKAFLFDLMPFVNRDGNMVTNERGIPMDAKAICKELGISKATFYVITKKLIDCGVLIQEPYENKVFFKFNEDYFAY